VPLHISEQRQVSRFCSLAIDCDADAALIRLDGALDLSCEEALRGGLARIMEWRPGAVVMDLGDITFIDSCGMRMLLELEAASQRDGFQLTLVNTRGQVRRSLRSTGLDLLLPLVEPLGGLATESK
jgi:anti-anti-sigma factor